MKIVITGGHLTPALAVISKLKKLAPKYQIYFFGRKFAVEGDKATSFEYLEIKNLAIPFFEITTGRLQRKLTTRTFATLAKILPGFVQSFFLLKKIKPELVLTFGGYLALPVAIAAKILGITVVAHEQSPNLGLANKIIFKFAALAGVSNRSLARKLSNKKIFFTGPLFREEIFEKQPSSKKLAQFLKKLGNKRLIYITGGATGSHFLNKTMALVLPQILKDNFVIHQTGNLGQSADFKKLEKKRKSLPKTLSEKYFLTEFVNSKDIGAVLNRADLVICRSGANTTSELGALAKVLIVIPLEWGKEQKEIAFQLEKLEAGLILPQENLTANKILAAISEIFGKFKNFKNNALNLEKEINSEGAEIFTRKILELSISSSPPAKAARVSLKYQ